MATIAEFSLFPVGKGESVGAYVARALAVVQRSGLAHQLGPMGTCIEGEWGEVMTVIQRCQEALAVDCDRVYCVIKIDYRKGKSGMIQSKVKSVEERMAAEER